MPVVDESVLEDHAACVTSLRVLAGLAHDDLLERARGGLTSRQHSPYTFLERASDAIRSASLSLSRESQKDFEASLMLALVAIAQAHANTATGASQ